MAYNQAFPAFEGMPSDNYERLKQQLLLLAHAEMCRRHRSVANGRCPVLYCNKLQPLLKHMNGCLLQRDCPVQNCTASKRIMTHFKYCKTAGGYCPVCDLLKFCQQKDRFLFEEDIFESYGPA